MSLYPNARAYLEEVIRRYRSLATYSDTGLSQALHGRRRRLVLFETDYRAPGDLRFHFESAHPYRRLRHLIARTTAGMAASKPYILQNDYSQRDVLEHPESLDMALACATGISSGTAHTIGALLFPEVSGFTLPDLRRIRFRSYKVIDGVRCIAITGLHPWKKGRYTAWFGAEDFMLRRLVRTGRFLTEELRTNIRTGHALADARFAFPAIEAAQSR